MANLGVQSPQTRSAQAFILSACRLTGTLRSGQNMSAAELTDCLQVLNDMLDSWSAKRVLIFTTPRITVDQNGNPFMLIPTQQSYTLGNLKGTENFLLPRPSRRPVVSILYSASQQTPVELPMDMYDDTQWQGIANKSTPSILPQVCYIETNMPDMQLNFWPIPTQANPVILYLWQVLAQFPNLQTTFTFPPGYARAIRFNLAMELFAEFSGDASKLPAVAAIAKSSKDDVEMNNIRAKEAYCDPALLGSGYPRGNIFTDTTSRTHP